MKIKIEDGVMKIDIYEAIGQLSDEEKKKFLEYFTFEEVLKAIENQLKRETETNCYWWSTGGDRDGATLREHILKIQGLEPEFKNDLESKIRSLEHNVAHYKKYFDWYYKVYHAKNENGWNDLFSQVVKVVGDVGR
jgi:hypothetical protein